MSETPSYEPAPRGKDASDLDDVFQAREKPLTPEAMNAAKGQRLQALLPGVPPADLKTLMASLNKAGTLDSLMALMADPKN